MAVCVCFPASTSVTLPVETWSLGIEKEAHRNLLTAASDRAQGYFYNTQTTVLITPI